MFIIISNRKEDNWSIKFTSHKQFDEKSEREISERIKIINFILMLSRQQNSIFLATKNGIFMVHQVEFE